MERLLIAINSHSLSDALTQDLSSRSEVHSCSTGTGAGGLIEKLRPDALIIDLQLSERNGLSVLESCFYRPPVIVALTDFIDDDVMHRANAAGVDILAQIPCSARCIVDHLECLIVKTSPPEL